MHNVRLATMVLIWRGEAGWDQPSVDGILKAPPHDETGHTWHHNNAYLIESIVSGGTITSRRWR